MVYMQGSALKLKTTLTHIALTVYNESPAKHGHLNGVFLVSMTTYPCITLVKVSTCYCVIALLCTCHP